MLAHFVCINIMRLRIFHMKCQWMMHQQTKWWRRVCVWGGEAHGILGYGFWNEGVGKEKIIPNNKGVGFQKLHVGKRN